MNFGLTGATGLIGKALSQKLIADGHSVIAFTRNPDRYEGSSDEARLLDLGSKVDVSDLDALQTGVEDALAQPGRWRRWRANGIEAVSRHYSWDAHATHYLGEALAATRQAAGQGPPMWFQQAVASSPSAAAGPGGEAGTDADGDFPRAPQRLLVLDLDVSLGSADDHSLAELRQRLGADPQLGIGVVSGRGFAPARLAYDALHLPRPCVWISEAGTEIHYGGETDHWLDRRWQAHIARDWDRGGVEAAMASLEPRLRRQSEPDQGPFKVSYLLSEPDQGILPLVRQTLRSRALMARPHLFHHWFLDVLPLTASKTEALRYLALRWQLPLNALLVEASQQGDGDLLRGLSLGVVPQDHDPSLDRLRGHRRVFFSTRPQAWGLLEGLDHHRFLRRVG